MMIGIALLFFVQPFYWGLALVMGGFVSAFGGQFLRPQVTLRLRDDGVFVAPTSSGGASTPVEKLWDWSATMVTLGLYPRRPGWGPSRGWDPERLGVDVDKNLLKPGISRTWNRFPLRDADAAKVVLLARGQGAAVVKVEAAAAQRAAAAGLTEA